MQKGNMDEFIAELTEFGEKKKGDFAGDISSLK